MERQQFIKIVSHLTDSCDTQNIYAEHLSELFDVIDKGKIGDGFSEAMENNDCHAAVCALARYYRSKPDFKVKTLSAKTGGDMKRAQDAVAGTFCVVNTEWTFKDGEADFLFDPTLTIPPRNHEWLWQFNRHGYWADMARAYVSTGDERYAKTFEKQLLKWIAQTYIPEDWNGPGSAWRTIECGIRLMGAWQIAYDGFKKSESVDDAALLLMIASMHRQALHLVNNPTTRNWLMMESNGVYAFSALFDELCDSETNRRIAAERLLEELEKQTLPDGMHNELSPDYQSVVFNCAANFYELALNLGFAGEAPVGIAKLIEKSADAAIKLSTPGFIQPKTNDTYAIHTRIFTERAEALLGKRAEYTFVNSCRSEGEPPEEASVFLPYAGFAVMRSDWGAESAYMCFDVGPLGVGHMHQDKLNINIYKGSQELIYDDGGGHYDISVARDYAISGYGHNTILVDGLAQNRKTPLQSEQAIDAKWVSNEEFDYAASVYDATFGDELLLPAVHKREVKFIKPDFFCVNDTLTSADGKAHDYELLFHMDTTKIKPLDGYKNAVISDYGKKYELVIIPIDDISAQPELKSVSGAVEPRLRGWYNGRNESKLHEAITVSREVKGVCDYRFTTLLFPIAEGQTLPIVRQCGKEIKIEFNGKRYLLELDKLNK